MAAGFNEIGSQTSGACIDLEMACTLPRPDCRAGRALAPRQYHAQMSNPSLSDQFEDDERRCDLCNEPVPANGGYGSGALADGLYCSLNCFALRDNRYVRPLTDLVREQGTDDES